MTSQTTSNGITTFIARSERIRSWGLRKRQVASAKVQRIPSAITSNTMLARRPILMRLAASMDGRPEGAHHFCTDRRNMRSIFSFVESQHAWEDCAAANAWFAALCAPLAAWPADCAALEA